MPTSGSSSTLANLIAQRAKLSSARQRMGLEGSNNIPQTGIMTPASPTPPSQPPAAVVGPQAQAVMGPPPAPSPQPQAPTPMAPGGAAPAGPMGFQPVTDAHEQAMPPAPGQPIQGTQDSSGQMMAMAHQFLETHGANQQALINQQKQQESKPNSLREFQQRMGRLPSPQELLVMGAQSRLTQTLGRAPTDEEVKQFFSSPQKESTNVPAPTDNSAP